MARIPLDTAKALNAQAAGDKKAKPIDYVKEYKKTFTKKNPEGSFDQAARNTGIARQTFRYRYDRQKRISFSEDERKFKRWTTEQCIAELRRIVEMWPDKVITRNFFRVHSNISESTWTRHFGTFTEFKRQANVIPSRHVHMMEKNVAKHAAADHYRELQAKLQGWDDKFKVKNPGRWMKMALAFDLHDKEIDLFWLRVWLDTLKRFQPDAVCFDGDLFDLPEFSKWTQDPRHWGAGKRIKFAHKRILRPTREAVGDDCLIDLIEGNHEFRLLRHLADSTPAMRDLLWELHGMTFEKLFGLDEFRINFIAYADLAANAWRQTDVQKELRRNFKIYGDGTLLAHHYPDGSKMGHPGCNGHHHRFEAKTLYNPTHGSYQWIQSGGGHKRDATYCEGELWNNSFLMATIDTVKKTVLWDPVFIGDEIAISGGKYYYRTDAEKY